MRAPNLIFGRAGASRASSRWIAGFTSSVPLPTLFGAVAVAGATLGAAAALFLLVKPIQRVMGGVK